MDIDFYLYFFASTEIIIEKFSPFKSITLIDFQMLSHFCMPGIYQIKLSCMTLYMYISIYMYIFSYSPYLLDLPTCFSFSFFIHFDSTFHPYGNIILLLEK